MYAELKIASGEGGGGGEMDPANQENLAPRLEWTF